MPIWNSGLDAVRRQYYRLLLSFMMVLCVLSIGLSVWSITNARQAQASEIHKQIYAIKKTFLKDTVHNVMRDIDEHRSRFRALGYDETKVDLLTKAAMTTSLHNKTFENDAYIWVNEIVNWTGGEKYAVRRIHPNLRDTEGITLSTSIQDLKGNMPYLTELQGIKKDGEVFSTYWFKR
ncbi:MAG: hypothetical protein WCT14_17050 [Treponemataceae bacterium]